MATHQERERARMEEILPGQGEVAADILAMMSTIGEQGDIISPDLILDASQAAGAQAAARWLNAGYSLDDCGVLRRYYDYMGQQIANDAMPGGRLHDATVASGTSSVTGEDHLAAHVRDEDVPPPRGIRHIPALESEPVALIATAGGYIDGEWEWFLKSRSARKLDGTWVLNNYPKEGVLALQFMGDHFSGFAELYKEDIRSARVAAKCINLVIEIEDCHGEHMVAVGPKRRLRKTFKQLGFKL